MTPTPSQLRALELFELVEQLPYRGDLVRAFAVARLLTQEGIAVSPGASGYFRLLNLPDKSIVGVDVLDIDDAMVCAKGIHQDWDGIALAYGASAENYEARGFSKFNPTVQNWLGPHGTVLVDETTDWMNAILQQQSLDMTAPQSLSRPATRL